jgi:DNA polymerase
VGKKRAVSQDDLWPILKTRDVNLVRAKYGKVMEALSHGLRGAITASPGHILYVADYAAIEARVLLWLAEDDGALDVFRNNEDIYCYMADDIYGYKTNKTDHPKERGIGKIAVLGLGYQMGPSKFVETCAAGGVTIKEDSECLHCGVVSREHRKVKTHDFEAADPDEITAVKVVDAYRSKFWRVKDMWNEQEATAIWAVENEGGEYSAGRVLWQVEGRFLYCTLPSGRKLAYPDPVVEMTTTSWGAERKQLTFMAVNTYNHQWMRQSTYGGMIVENITQAVARDLMADAFMRCEETGIYKPVLTVHDELIAEALAGIGSVHDFEALVAKCEPWAAGLPVAAEGWCGFRYHK